MTDRTGIFAGDDPFAIARAWLDAARPEELSDPDAIALATTDAAGVPDVRMVLMREIEPEAFLFYTNYDSTKGRQIAATGTAAFALHWKSLRRQIRARGPCAREEGPKADAYFANRSAASRLGAWASRQSAPLASRAALEEAVAQMRAEKGPAPARPPFWGGFRLCPLEIEFWADGADRLHDRFRWSRESPTTSWRVERLNP